MRRVPCFRQSRATQVNPATARRKHEALPAARFGCADDYMWVLQVPSSCNQMGIFC